jgi:hypothetical protein
VVWPRWVVVRGSGGVAKLLLLLHTLRLLGFQSLAERVGVDVSAFVVGKIVVLLGNPSRGKPDPPQLCPPFPISSNRYSNKTTMKILALPRWRPPGCPARRHTRERAKSHSIAAAALPSLLVAGGPRQHPRATRTARTARGTVVHDVILEAPAAVAVAASVRLLVCLNRLKTMGADLLNGH